MDQELSLAAGEPVAITFVPHLMPMVRGILATCYAMAKAKVTSKDVEAAYRKRYGKEPFRPAAAPGAASVHEGRAGSNFCDIAWRVDEKSRRVVVVSAIGQPGEGRSRGGGAMLQPDVGIPEEEGLRRCPCSRDRDGGGRPRRGGDPRPLRRDAASGEAAG